MHHKTIKVLAWNNESTCMKQWKYLHETMKVLAWINLKYLHGRGSSWRWGWRCPCWFGRVWWGGPWTRAGGQWASSGHCPWSPWTPHGRTQGPRPAAATYGQCCAQPLGPGHLLGLEWRTCQGVKLWVQVPSCHFIAIKKRIGVLFPKNYFFFQLKSFNSFFILLAMAR